MIGPKTGRIAAARRQRGESAQEEEHSMRAVVLREFGAASQLRMEEAPDPEPRAGWTTVRLRASALNWHDVLVRQGTYSSPLPHIIGADGAGVTSESGEDVVILPGLGWGSRESAPGRDWQILGDHIPGTYAEFVRVPDECVVPKPRHLDWLEAAALPLVGATTYRALFSRGGLIAGESILILGAGGGVATMALALASAVGATVVVTSSTADKIAAARTHGAAGGVLYSDDDWAEQARHLSPGGEGFDVILDSVGDWARCITALRPGGRLVVLGASRSAAAELAVRPFYFGQYSILGTTMGSRRDLDGLLEMIAAKNVAPPMIDSVYPLDEAALAHEYLETGDATGKIVLTHD
jgi:zinc-binding alcohol dehydrogenase/oxidoreductase